MTATQGIIVIGGGPAGAAAAILLARRGHQVTVLEAAREPQDKVCGEFLSPETLGALDRLGVDPWALGAVPIERVTMAAGPREASAPLPFPAASLSRRILDEALLERARSAGAAVERGCRVRKLEASDGTWRAGSCDGRTFAGREALLATGKHDIRGWRRPAGLHPGLVGLKLPLRLEGGNAGLAGRVILALFRDGYAGLQPTGGDGATLCLLVDRRLVPSGSAEAERVLRHAADLAPVLRDPLQAARPLATRALAVSAIPFGLVRRRVGPPWRLGDQAAVTASFTGTGIGLALRSAEIAARCLEAGLRAEDYHAALASEVAGRVRGSAWASRLLVRPWAQHALLALLDRAPGLLSFGAAHTRLVPGSGMPTAARG